jgi:TatA/E family protein of Tat protein translocase
MSAAALAFVAAAPAPTFAFLEGIGAMEMMLVGIIGLLLFGGRGLPDMARTLGKVVREFKKASANVEEEVKRVMNEEPAPAPKPRPRPQTVSLPPATATPPAALERPGELPPPAA